MFKNHWEKTSALNPLSQSTIEQMIKLAYPDKTLVSYELLAGGCANLNYQIQFVEEKKPLILRVYLRDQHAVHREQKLAALLKSSILVPQIYHIGQFELYHFAIAEWMPGITLRELLLSDIPYNISALMHEVGVTLAGIAKMKPMAQLAALQVALTPRVVEQQDDLKEISSDASNAVVGTQAVASSSTPAPAVKLADTILTSDAGKTVLAKIRRHADAVAVLEQMNELSLRSIDKNAPKWAGNSQFMNLNAQQLVTFLVGAAAKCQQVITVEAPKPATTTLKI